MKTFQASGQRVSTTIPTPIRIVPSDTAKNSKRMDHPAVMIFGKQSLSENQQCADRVRHYCLYTLTLVLAFHAAFGEIKNGYEENILGAKEALTILRQSLISERDMSAVQRRKVQATITTLLNHITYYDLTENLLIHFRSIAPELYSQIDTITDRLGRPVNVHIRFVPIDGTDVKAEGTTYMKQSDSDIDACKSEYGEFTVSVKVWIVPRALLVLAHELGHVKYQVPNLASYMSFYRQRYNSVLKTNSIGHDVDDPSGQSAIQSGHSFQKNYALTVSMSKVHSPIAVLAKLKKNWTKNPAVL